MKAKVDPQACIGCRLCVNICPGVFEMDGTIAKAKTVNVPDDMQSCCREAVEIEGGPVDAISIE